MSYSKEDFFCPAPWQSMYYHVDMTTPCHSIRNAPKLNPEEYFKSKWLHDLKKDFVEGKVPDACTLCKQREDLGIKSTRQQEFKNRNEEPLNIDRNSFTLERETKLVRLEIRTSNLCNSKCRMCAADSSSEIAKEQNITHINYSNEDAINQLKKLSLDGAFIVCFTGGEPMLIKQYYEFMDHIIENKLNEKIGVELFSNCTVYNPIFMDKLMQFKEVRFVMSIDGVGKTAEYIRHGMDWKNVEQNIYKFTVLPKTIYFNTAISSYVLLDVSNFAKFLMKLQGMNDKIRSKCYTVIGPKQLHFLNLYGDLRKRAINEINEAVEVLTADNFNIFKKELLDIKTNLESSEIRDPISFIKYTQNLDKLRNESFEDTFGIKLF